MAIDRVGSRHIRHDDHFRNGLFNSPELRCISREVQASFLYCPSVHRAFDEEQDALDTQAP